MTDDLVQRIDEILAHGEPLGHGTLAAQSCPHCGHDWHGLRCAPPTWWYVNPPLDGAHRWPCDCPSSLAEARPRPPARDDSWRPRLRGGPQERISQVMHDTGMDGYAVVAQFRLTAPSGIGAIGALDRIAAAVAASFGSAARAAAEEHARQARAAIPDGPWVTVGYAEPDQVTGLISADSIVDERRIPNIRNGRIVDQRRIATTHYGRVWIAPLDQGTRLARLADHMHVDFTATADAITRLTDHLRDAGVLPEQPSEDPMARALWLRQHRNTGPARPTATQAHRPRRHAGHPTTTRRTP